MGCKQCGWLGNCSRKSLGLCEVWLDSARHAGYTVALLCLLKPLLPFTTQLYSVRGVSLLDVLTTGGHGA